MKKKIVLLFLMSLVSFNSFADLKWHTNASNYISDFNNSNKRFIMIDFYVDWCGWCTKLDRETYSDSRVQKALNDFICYRYNPDKDSAARLFANDVGLKGYPMIILYDNISGKRVDINGYVNADKMLSKINNFIASCPKTTSIKWETDIDKALQRAKDEKKLLFIDVTVDWCGWCVKLDKEVYTDKQVAELMKKFVCIKINPETSRKGADFIKKYNITGYPSLLFTSGSGYLIDSIPGFVPASTFSNKLYELSSQIWY